MQTKLAENIVEKYKLKDKQKIFFYELKSISRKEEIDIKDLIFILGVNRNIIYKTESSWTRINLLKEVSIRQKIKLIKLDLCYLSEYGQRNYTKQEIIQICNEYKVSFNDFITYIGYKKISYYENMYILENNKKGLWIGKNIELSTEFYCIHYKEITRNLEYLSLKFSNRYNCRWMKDDLYEVAMKKIINRGDIERNLCFDEEKLLGKLFYTAKYAILNQIIINFKNINYSDCLNLRINNLCENIEYEEFIEEDSIYEWIKEIEFNIMHKSIILGMIRQRYNIIENRAKALCVIRQKLKISSKELYNEINNLQEIFINSAKVRVCKNGKVILNGK